MPTSGKGDKTSQIAREELIGLETTVVASGHAPYLGVEGRVVDETRGTLVIDVGGREVVVPKRGQRFRFRGPEGDEEVDGSVLTHPPEERIRKIR